MSVVSRWVQERRERERRLATAREAVHALSPDERAYFLAELVEAAEREPVPSPDMPTSRRARDLGGPRAAVSAAMASKGPPGPVVPEGTSLPPAWWKAYRRACAETSQDPERPLSDRIERAVIASPRGLTVAEVAAQIGSTNVKSVDSLLRHVAHSRKTVVRRDKRYVATGKAVEASREPRHKVEDLVLRVLGAGTPLGTGAIFQVIHKSQADVKRGSVSVAVARLLQEERVVVTGSAGRGPAYALATRSEVP